MDIPVANLAPEVDAGPDQTIDEGTGGNEIQFKTFLGSATILGRTGRIPRSDQDHLICLRILSVVDEVKGIHVDKREASVCGFTLFAE